MNEVYHCCMSKTLFESAIYYNENIGMIDDLSLFDSKRYLNSSISFVFIRIDIFPGLKLFLISKNLCPGNILTLNKRSRTCLEYY